MKTLDPAVPVGHTHDPIYNAFLTRLQARFTANLAGTPHLFTTEGVDLWMVYLNSFPDAVERQHHNCNACRHFVQRFGHLAQIDNHGNTTSAVWNESDAPPAYTLAIHNLRKEVESSKVTGVFLSSDKVWGTPKTGDWTHLAVTPPPAIVHKDRILTAFQASAAKSEDFNTVMRALNEFTQPHLEVALKLLESDALYRSEKVLGQAKWLHTLHVARMSVWANYKKANVVWAAVAAAPAGFCHPRSSMIGTLLEDIAAGMAYEDVSKRFAAKMHPLQYQRPQAAPTAGAIASAEKLVQQLGVAGSLARRFARLDEVRAVWRPSPKKAAPADGIFGHLKPKGAAPASTMNIPAQTMTWDKFQRTVLPTAERIEFMTPRTGSYTALVTAVNADAPPILQWDHEDARNPVSWYFWRTNPSAASFGLPANQFVEVEAITLKPSMWNGGNEHQGVGVMFVLAGAHETKMHGSALFPECLKSEFHGIRSVIEAYSRNDKIAGMNEPHAAGLMVTQNEKTWNVHVRVTTNGVSSEYKIDRWD